MRPSPCILGSIRLSAERSRPSPMTKYLPEGILIGSISSGGKEPSSRIWYASVSPGNCSSSNVALSTPIKLVNCEGPLLVCLASRPLIMGTPFRISMRSPGSPIKPINAFLITRWVHYYYDCSPGCRRTFSRFNKEMRAGFQSRQHTFRFFCKSPPRAGASA